jgi:hypothetical protein
VLDDAGELRQADDARSRYVRDVREPGEGQQVGAHTEWDAMSRTTTISSYPSSWEKWSS